MRHSLFVLLLLGSFPLANPSQHDSRPSKGEITVQGCVSRSAGDFILMKHDPGMSYQLHAPDTINLNHYLGQQVEVTGKDSPSLSTSSSPSGRVGSSSVALTITSIKTIDKRCSAQ